MIIQSVEHTYQTTGLHCNRSVVSMNIKGGVVRELPTYKKQILKCVTTRAYRQSSFLWQEEQKRSGGSYSGKVKAASIACLLLAWSLLFPWRRPLFCVLVLKAAPFCAIRSFYHSWKELASLTPVLCTLMSSNGRSTKTKIIRWKFTRTHSSEQACCAWWLTLGPLNNMTGIYIALIFLRDKEWKYK